MKHYASPRWSGEIADCSMPMTFDQYGKCAYRCVYCFATFRKAVGNSKDNYLTQEVLQVDPARVKKIFLGESKSQFEMYIKQRKVFQWGGMADPFCPFEKKSGVGLELLRFFRDIEYPICLSTKGTWWTKDERYIELFRGNKNWNVKVSIITPDEQKARKVELGCPSVAERLDAIEAIAGWGCGGATLRLRPFIIGISSPGHAELIREAGRRGAGAVSTEFLCLEVRSTILRDRINVMSGCAGIDLWKFYREHSAGVGYLRLNRNVKRPYVDEMEQACRESGMRFYISDAHFKERCANGSCCGLPPDWNYSRGQFTEALVLCRKNGRVTWEEISGDLDYAKEFMWWMAAGFNTTCTEKRAKYRSFTMFDYMRYVWNKPKHGQSPYKMFEGIMKPTSVDGNGNIVYEYDPSRE